MRGRGRRRSACGPQPGASSAAMRGYYIPILITLRAQRSMPAAGAVDRLRSTVIQGRLIGRQMAPAAPPKQLLSPTAFPSSSTSTWTSPNTAVDSHPLPTSASALGPPGCVSMPGCLPSHLRPINLSVRLSRVSDSFLRRQPAMRASGTTRLRVEWQRLEDDAAARQHRVQSVVRPHGHGVAGASRVGGAQFVVHRQEVKRRRLHRHSTHSPQPLLLYHTQLRPRRPHYHDKDIVNRIETCRGNERMSEARALRIGTMCGSKDESITVRIMVTLLARGWQNLKRRSLAVFCPPSSIFPYFFFYSGDILLSSYNCRSPVVIDCLNAIARIA